MMKLGELGFQKPQAEREPKRPAEAERCLGPYPATQAPASKMLVNNKSLRYIASCDMAGSDLYLP